jgi:viroplasmin and RNaseH domain-containing protein
MNILRDEAKRQVNGFSNARYKKFDTEKEALDFIHDKSDNTFSG